VLTFHLSPSEFAVKIPDLTAWLQDWGFEQIDASPDLGRGQSVVDFAITCRRKDGTDSYLARFHTEVRYSHGKFSSVEAKTYKEFNWVSLPFFDVIL
jgi:hypothetical protein